MQTSLQLRLPFVLILLIAGGMVFGVSKVGPPQPDRVAGLVKNQSAQENYGNLPLAFEPNAGQADPSVRFLAHGRGMTVFFTDNEAVMVIHKAEKSDLQRVHGQEAHLRTETAVVRMKLAGARRPRLEVGLDKLPGITNYFIGNDPAKWRANISNYAHIRYKGVYPGVDLICYGKEGQLEYDLVVAPGADPRQIELAWEGADRLELNADGDLVLATRLGDIVQKRPRVYQQVGARRVEVAAAYSLHGGSCITFELARYDRSRPLVIDPVTVVYGSYLGYSQYGTAIAVDSAGAAYVAGLTYDTIDPGFPVVSPFQSTNPTVNGPCGNASGFVSKIAPSGSSLVYSTYLGGNCDDEPAGIAVDANGSAYVVGTSWSLNSFPVLLAYQSNCTGNYKSGVYVTKFSPAGNSLEYSTYLCAQSGGSDVGTGIAVDTSGYAYVTGYTDSETWPLQSPYQGQNHTGSQTGFVTKLTQAGSSPVSLVYSTYLGGSGNDYPSAIAVDGLGSAYVTGQTKSMDFPTVTPFQYRNNFGDFTGFVTKFLPSGASLAYSTYLGGSTGSDRPTAIAVDAGDAAFVTGVAYSTDFPLQRAIQSTNKDPDAGNCFVTKLATLGTTLIYSTYLGGSPTAFSSGDICNSIAADSEEEAYVTGETHSPDFPLLSPYQATIPSTNIAFVTKFSKTGTLSYSTFLGGSGDTIGNGIALDSAGAAYVTGETSSDDFPAPSGFQETNGVATAPFVAKLQFSGAATTLVTTGVAGLTFSVDGSTYIQPQIFTWTAGSSHTISVNSPQAQAGHTGTRYVFANWSDGGLQTHDITASSAGGTYTANFTEEYLLSVSVSPIAGGAVTETPVSSDGSGYYSSGALVSLTASPSVGYVFSGWGSGGHLIASASPQPVSMTAPWALTASFALRNICDIIGYATTNVADVQMIINEALGVTPAVNDLSADGVVNIADVQIVINAAAGLGCTPQ